MPREHERITYRNEIYVDSSSGKGVARISDLSRGGCFVDSILPVQVGEEVSLKISFDKGGPVKIKGTVAYRSQGMGFGVSFRDLPEHISDMLDNIVPTGGDGS